MDNKTEFLFVCWFLFGLGLGFLGIVVGIFETVWMT